MTDNYEFVETEIPKTKKSKPKPVQTATPRMPRGVRIGMEDYADERWGTRFFVASCPFCDYRSVPCLNEEGARRTAERHVLLNPGKERR